MLARSFRSQSIVALVTLATAACASTASTVSRSQAAASPIRPLAPTSRVFDAERIRRSGAITAWDAVRILVPHHRLDDARATSLRMLSMPGMTRLESSIRLILDGNQIIDVDALRSILAEDLVSIEMLTASEAAVYLGPWAAGGAIVVRTRTRLAPR